MGDVMKKIYAIAALLLLVAVLSSCSNPASFTGGGKVENVSSKITVSEISSQISSEIFLNSSGVTSSEHNSSAQTNSPNLVGQGAGVLSSRAPEVSSNPPVPPKPNLDEIKASNKAKALEIINNITNGSMTNIEKAKATYLWLYPNFKYRTTRVDLSNGYTDRLTEELAHYYFKYHKGSCEHYAAVQKILLRELNIESYYVIGERYSSLSKKWGEHTWLMAEINGNMYHVDGLFGGLFYNVKETTFMVPDSAIEKTHRWNRNTYMPCTNPQLLK